MNIETKNKPMTTPSIRGTAKLLSGIIVGTMLHLSPSPVYANMDGANHSDPQNINEHMATMSLVPYENVTHTSVRDGYWSDAATWGGEVPPAGASVLIDQGHSVIVDGEILNTMMTLRVDGKLQFATDVETMLRVDTLVIDTGGAFEMGSAYQPIDASVQARLVIDDINDGIVTDDATSPYYDPFQLGQGVISHGRFDMHGAEKTSIATIVKANIGDWILELDEEPLGWNVGDEIVIAGTTIDAKGEELRTVTQIDGTFVYLDSPLQNNHVPPRHTKEGLELKVHIANLSRNAVIETAIEDRGSSLDSTDSYTDRYKNRAHLMFMHNSIVDVRYGEFNHLGRTNKTFIADDTVADVDGVITHIGNNPRARYSLHFHRGGRDSVPARIHGNSVVNSPGWAYVNHGSNVIMTQNVAYDIRGAAFVSERGDEKGSFIGNLAIKTHNWKDPKGKDGQYHGRNIEDFGYAGAGFWLQGMDVITRDNVASGASFAGFAIWPLSIDSAGPAEANGKILHVADNQTYGNRVAINVAYTFRYSTMENIVNHVTWKNRQFLISDYNSEFSFLRPVILGDLDNPVGTGIAYPPRNNGARDRRFLLPHVEGFLVGYDAKTHATAGVVGGYFNNVVNILHNNSGRNYAKGRRDVPELSAYAGLKFGTMSGTGLALGLERVNQLAVLRNQWAPAGQTPITLSTQTDYLFLYAMPPNRLTDFELTFATHRQWVELGGTTYEVFLKREQSGDYVPFPSVVSQYYDPALIDPNWLDKTNDELNAMGAGVVSGHLLPPDWQVRNDFMDAATEELFNTSGIRFNNAVLREIPPGDPEEFQRVEAEDNFVTYESGVPKNGSRYWYVADNDLAQWNEKPIMDAFKPQHGTSSRKWDKVFYKPEDSFTGVDVVPYAIRDAFGEFSIGLLYVAVGSSTLPSNTVPVTTDDEYNLSTGETIVLDVLANDDDAEGQSLYVRSVGDEAVGTAVPQQDGTIVYTAADYFTGKDKFTYQVMDAEGMVSMKGEVIVNLSHAGNGNNVAPIATFDSSISDLTVNFTDYSTDSDGSVVSWSWEFGDGRVSTEPNPSHTYASVGVYTVTLVVTDSDGLTGSTSLSVTVTEPPVSQLPAAPTNLVATVTRTGKGKSASKSVSLVWDDNSTNEDHFVVERCQESGKGKGKTCVFQYLTTTTSPTFSEGGLSGTFKYRVRAENGAGSSASSNEVKI